MTDNSVDESGKPLVEGFQTAKTRIDRFIGACLLVVVLAGGTVGWESYSANRTLVEAWLYPTTSAWTFRDWEQVPEDAWEASMSDGTLASSNPDVVGKWSSVVHFYKNREECRFIPGQAQTASFVTAEGAVGETQIVFLDDFSVDNSRTGGWLRMDFRVVFTHPAVSIGTRLRNVVFHQCAEGRQPVPTGYRNIVVGEQMVWPDFVQRWLDSGRAGIPADYR